MSRYVLCCVVLVFVIFLNVFAVAEEKKVALPALPKGAGAVDKDAPKTFTVTPSGLKYRVLRKGNGAAPTATKTVKVHFYGWLDNGKKFDSTYDRKEPISIPLFPFKTLLAGEISPPIKGWIEGMQLVGTGGMIELEIPADLGYGAQGAGKVVPPNATLHFLVELLEVEEGLGGWKG